MKVLVVLLVAIVSVLMAGSARAQGSDPDIALEVSPALVDLDLGANFDIQVEITNTGPNPVPSLVVHLDILDPGQDVSVDPEDWTPTLNKTVGALAAGQKATLTWNLQPISGGTFVAYAVGLEPGGGMVVTSNVVEVTVADKRSLNPSGILPVAVAIPAFVGTLLATQMRRSRRPRADSVALT